MKTTIRTITTLCIVIFMTILILPKSADAQRDRNQVKQKNTQPGAKHEKMEAQRIAYITKELNLTPDEAKVFWPVYNEFESKRNEMKKSFHSEGRHKEDNAQPSEKEALVILDNQIIEAQKFLDLRKEYHSKFKAVLPAVKVLKLYETEREFQKMLIDKLRDNRQKPPLNNKK